jgi:(S)-ureidoglycine aminohydrolase
VIEGNHTAGAQGKSFPLTKGGYIYCPPGEKLTFINNRSGNSQLFLYKRRYIAVENHAPYLVTGNVSQLERIHYEGMEDVILIDFLPKELGFDMNMHILSFEPGASHGYIETHVQEHGAYILSGQGVYNLDNNWVPVKKATISLWALIHYRPDTASGARRLATFTRKIAIATLRSDCH